MSTGSDTSTPTPPMAVLATEVAALRPRMEAVSLAIHGRPELKFAEFHAQELLTDWLAEAGFTVQAPVGGVATAFAAVHQGSRPGPYVAVLAEYDALPGVGHGCGHNLIAAGAAAAAIAAVRALPDHPGTVAVLGTPGEEMGGAGKVLLAEAGVFDDVDAAMMFHPGDRSLTTRTGLAAAHLRIGFTGVSAHASISPWLGRSALAGAQLFLQAIDAMRQFVPPTVRLHGIVSDGGQAPNVVPAYAAVDLYVRDRTATSVEALLGRVRDAAEGAALATGTEAMVRETGPLYAERRDNLVLAERFGAAVRALGVEIRPGDPDSPAGSSDIGNLSRLLPVIHPYIQIADTGTPSHSGAMREAAATPLAHDRTQVAATGLARVVTELLTRPDLLAAARAEFAARAEAVG
ncbi:M20 family metallopeptidase [Plantactinospora endophytica]|uniref:Peptidase M20 domain-containing protein 2 n=1 Tax=Plantactinospora endophytica TaxID=673535 RepID=A0ABQ4E911_9ACTN|nr:M20 family metallopeptidase [Plantactinospora endophytica]GIG91161.1 amidohydrolase [Plantactinospora endophytica]